MGGASHLSMRNARSRVRSLSPRCGTLERKRGGAPAALPQRPISTEGWTRRVQLVRRDGRDVSTLYGREGRGGERCAHPRGGRSSNWLIQHISFSSRCHSACLRRGTLLALYGGARQMTNLALTTAAAYPLRCGSLRARQALRCQSRCPISMFRAAVALGPRYGPSAPALGCVFCSPIRLGSAASPLWPAGDAPACCRHSEEEGASSVCLGTLSRLTLSPR